MTMSASAARIQGDDYQHLFAWYHALRMLDPAGDVVRIEIEARDAGHVDDVVVRCAAGPDEYYQVKYSVDARHPIDRKWLLQPARSGGTSHLQKLWASWQLLRARGHAHPRLGLYTNRPLDVSDPVLTLRDGTHNCLVPRLAQATPGSRAGQARAEWAAHLGTSEQDLLDMLAHLRIFTDQTPWSGFLESVADRMRAMGLDGSDHAVERGTLAVRAWVKDGRREIDRDILVEEIDRRALRAGPRQATLIIQAIDRVPWAEGATACVDWVDLFEGDEPRVRRRPRDPAAWNTRMRSELRAAEQRIRRQGFDRVLVRGHLRLTTAFAAGAELADTRGYTVACDQRGAVWSSDVTPAPVDLLPAVTQDLGHGPDLAVGLSVSSDLAADMAEHIAVAKLPIGRLVHLAVAPTPSNTALHDCAEARGWALAVKQLVHTHARQIRPPVIHLFLSAPLGAALLLGHAWNSLPATQLYEHIPAASYIPSFFIPA